MSFEPRDYLRHILVEADYLMAHTAGLTREEFVANETLRRAFVRSVEIIGEAAMKVPQEFRTLYPTVEWRMMAGMRDRLILFRCGLRTGLGCRPEPHSGVASSDRVDARGISRLVRHHHVQSAAVQGVLRQALRLGVHSGARN